MQPHDLERRIFRRKSGSRYDEPFDLIDCVGGDSFLGWAVGGGVGVELDGGRFWGTWFGVRREGTCAVWYVRWVGTRADGFVVKASQCL